MSLNTDLGLHGAAVTAGGECGDGQPGARLNPKFRTDTGLINGKPCPNCHTDAKQQRGLPA